MVNGICFYSLEMYSAVGGGERHMAYGTPHEVVSLLANALIFLQFFFLLNLVMIIGFSQPIYLYT